MIRIYQKTPTSCFAACIASVIECEFEDVPDCFHAPTWDHWEQRHWLEKRGYGMAEHKILPDSMWQPTKGMICILAGKSPRGECDHAVVAETDYDTAEPFRIIHDASILRYLIKELNDEINPPERNCSCHISPPCSDCVDHEHARELKARAESYIA